MAQTIINCIAIIGKQNNPLHIKNFHTAHSDLKYHYIAHTSCDVLEERAASSTKLADTYFGLLFTLEDLAVYGYMTNTRVKFVLVLGVPNSQVVKDADVKNTFKAIHMAWIAQLSNPFFPFPDSDSVPLLPSAMGAPGTPGTPAHPTGAPHLGALPSRIPGVPKMSRHFMEDIAEIGKRGISGAMMVT